MSKENIKKDLKIDTLVNTGVGLAKDDGYPIFVDSTVPGDIINAKLISTKKTYAKGIVQEITTPSKHRKKPFCPMANVCGGCNWQYIDYEYQLEAKREIVKDCLKKIGGIDTKVQNTMPCDSPEQYRAKVQYPISQTQSSKRFIVGYYKKGTHEIVNIKHCPIQPKIIDIVTKFFREKAQELGIKSYNEKKHKGTIRHLIYRYSQDENNMVLTIVVNDKKISGNIRKLAQDLKDEFKQVAGVCVNYNTEKTNKILGDRTVKAIGDDFIIEKIKDKRFKVSAGSFFQVNINSATKLLDEVKRLVKEHCDQPTILDAYSGVGTFGIYLSDLASSVTAVEEYPKAVADAKVNIKMNGIKNIDLIKGDAKEVFKSMVSNDQKFDVVIIDPPRKGSDKEAIDAVANLSNKYIIYVSCNPSTLARDLKLLQEKGFSPKHIQPVDMFPQTHHVESIVLLSKTTDSTSANSFRNNN